MKFSLILTIPFFLLFGNSPSQNLSSTFSDSLPIEHKLDGHPDEWPATVWKEDADTHLSYGIDNDASDLYIVLLVEDRAEQMKMIRMGMRLFIDLKAKKKENMGIEFPVKREAGSGISVKPAEPSGDGIGMQRPDPKEMRERMAALYMYSLKTFGFLDQDEAKETGLTMFNSVNLAYSWDENNKLTIEYKIPLSMIDEPKALQNKEVSIGWKIFGVDIPSVGGAGMASGGAGRGGGGRPGGGRPPSGSGNSGGGTTDRQQQFEEMRKEQHIWTHYTIQWQEGSKGF